MSLAQMIRRAVGGKGKGMEENPKPEDETEETVAEGEEEEKDAEGDDPEKDAEDDDPEKDAEDDDPDKDAEGDDPDKDADEEDPEKGMNAAQKSAFAKGRKVERKRIGAILGSAQAEANPALAAHLAFRTADAPKKALSTLKAGGAAGSGGLASRMNGRAPSRTGRGGETASRHADAGRSWDGAMAKAGVKVKGK